MKNMIKQELEKLQEESNLDFNRAFRLLGLKIDDITNPPIINWEDLENRMSNWEDIFSESEIDIDYVDDLIHILKKSYYYKTLETIEKVRKSSGFPLDNKGRPQIPTHFEVKSLNLKGMGLNKVFDLYNFAGYEKINSGIFPEMVTWELIASRKCFLLERVGYQFYREQKVSVEDCLNVTSLIERRLEHYIVDCPWAVYSDNDTSWKTWRD